MTGRKEGRNRGISWTEGTAGDQVWGLKNNKNHLLMPDCGSEHRFVILAYTKNTILTDTEGLLSCVPI